MNEDHKKLVKINENVSSEKMQEATAKLKVIDLISLYLVFECLQNGNDH